MKAEPFTTEPQDFAGVWAVQHGCRCPVCKKFYANPGHGWTFTKFCDHCRTKLEFQPQ